MTLTLPSAPAWVAVDTETSGLHPDDGARVACVSITWLAAGDYHTLAFPFDQGVRDKFPQLDMDLALFGGGEDPNLPREDWDALLEWLSHQELIFHNAKFDLTLLRVGTRHWPGRDLESALYWDTMLAQRVLEPMHPAGLDATARRLDLGHKEGLDEIKGWLVRRGYEKNRYDLAPWDLVEPYVTADTEMTARLFMHQWSQLVLGSSYHGRIERELDLTRALYRMEERGISYDAVASAEAADLLEQRANDIERSMPFRCNPTEAHNYFFQKLRLQPVRVSEKTNRPSLDEETVRQWVKDGVEWAEEYSIVTKARRAVSMWYRGYPEKIGLDGRLRCIYRQGHVKSGRMSVERVQLQAMPKSDKYSAVGSSERMAIYDGVPGVRELLKSKDGHGLWSLDLSQAELRVASRYSGCKRMLEELQSDDPDIHGKTTEGVMKIPRDHPQWKEKRDIGKRLTFGGIFLIGGETFQATLSKLADIHLPLDECNRLVWQWRGMYPEYQVAWKKAMQKVERDGYVRLLPGTEYEIKSYFLERDYPNTAWNRIVQGSLAEGFKIWLGEIEKRWPGYAILTVHDSVLLECPLDEGDQVASEVAAYGAKLFTDLFKIDMSVDTDRW